MTKERKGRDGITQLADGRWQARVTVGYKEGKQQRKAVYGKTYAECKERLTTLRHDQDRGLPVKNDQMTVKRYLEGEWLPFVAGKVRETTYAGYRSAVDKHIVPAIGRIRLTQLTPRDVEAMLRTIARKRDERKGRGGAPLSATQVAYTRVVLRAALSKAMEWEMVSRNVAKLASAPECVKYVKQPLTAEEAQAFLAAVADDRLSALYTVAMYIGLRKGEILGLTWENVDFDKGTLTVAKQIQRIKGVKQSVDTKTKMSARTVAMPPPVVDALWRHRTRQKEERLLAGSRWQDHGLVFPSSIGTPQEASNLSRAFLAALARTGSRRVRFHDLRHTAATIMQSRGVRDVVLSNILGHSRISTTMDMYVKVQDEDLREAAAKMGALFGP
ncbi:MAG: tyrosine-type recombinase/integrase [Thermomicrobiales bacterium]